MPDILLKGRFWAEEGNVFFLTALTQPWWKALFTPYGGYLDLVPNIGAVIARHFLPLGAAPYGTSATALLVQCIPAVLIVSSRDRWLQPRFVMMSALLLLGTAVAAGEVWISSIGCTAHLALAVALVLALEVPRGRLLAFQLFVLLLGALTAPGCWVLTVLFVARAVAERSIGRGLQALALFAGVVVQLLFFFSEFGRAMSISPSVFGAAVFAKNIVVPLLGIARADVYLPDLAALYSERGGPIWPLLVSVGLFALLAGWSLRQPYQSPLWFLLAAGAVGSTGYIGAFDDDKLVLISSWVGSRYAVAPQCLVALALLSWSRTFTDGTRFLAGVLTFWMLAVNVEGYFHRLPIFATGPAWRDEVAKWRSDPDYTIALWPRGWTVKLPAEALR